MNDASDTGSDVGTGLDDEPLSGGRFGAFRNALRAVVRTPLFLLSHVASIRSVARSTATVGVLDEPPPASPTGDRFQTRRDGVGPLVLRRYEIDLDGDVDTARGVIATFRSDPNRITATSVAAFMVGDEPARDLTEGDQLLVELAGPWNGPVEVIEVTSASVVMATLEDHMEAGIIRFDVTEGDGDGRGRCVFRITSWARAGDERFRFLHLTVPVGREIQTAMWVAMCRRAARVNGGSERRVRVMTEICEATA